MKTKNYEVYGKKLHNLRIQKRISVEELAKSIGLSRRTIWSWENNRTKPSISNICLLSNVLETSSDNFCNLEKNDYKKSKLLIAFKDKENQTASEDGVSNNNIDYLVRKIREYSNIKESCLFIIKAILNSSKDLIYIKNANNKYIHANNNFVANASLPFDIDINKKNDSYFFSSKEAILNSQEDIKIIHGEKTKITREDVIPGSRKKKKGIVTKAPLLGDRNKLYGVIGIFHIISNCM
ncbi:MAG TPA: helix-turn-helix transcriptional regulator [Victivallales bacterium]|nr:helix-turn-helix transcriptional regulator [Victivallales bacterium]